MSVRFQWRRLPLYAGKPVDEGSKSERASLTEISARERGTQNQ
jgi:hypothetical protein